MQYEALFRQEQIKAYIILDNLYIFANVGWKHIHTPDSRSAVTAMKVMIGHIRVDRSRTNQESLTTTSRVQDTDRLVVKNAPRSNKMYLKLIFFKPKPWEYTCPDYINNEDLAKAFDRRDWKPVDLQSLADFNTQNPSFVNNTPHGIHWKDESGKWCVAGFALWFGEPYVDIGHMNSRWLDYWWFVGVRK